MIALLFADATSAQPVASPEIVVLAELRSLTLTRRDWAAERDAMAQLPANAPIVLSNACGEAEATFRVIRATAPLDREISVSDTIGEWCTPPWGFSQWRWLVVIDAETKALVESYPVFAQNAALFAEAERESDRVRSEGVRRMLALAPLPTPLEYKVSGIPGEHLRRWVNYRPALEMRDGKVWLVRAIAVNAIFPGVTEESLEP